MFETSKLFHFVAKSRVDYICELVKAGFTHHMMSHYLIPIVRGGHIITYPLHFTIIVVDNVECRINMADSDGRICEYDWYCVNVLKDWAVSRLTAIDDFLLDKDGL